MPLHRLAQLRLLWQDAWVEYAAKIAQGLSIEYNSEIERISRLGPERGADFVLKVKRGKAPGAKRSRSRTRGDYVLCKYVIVATGFSTPFVPDIEGIEEATGYEDLSTEPSDYRNQSVLILGKGRSAVETADAIRGSAARVFMVSPSDSEMPRQRGESAGERVNLDIAEAGLRLERCAS